MIKRNPGFFESMDLSLKEYMSNPLTSEQIALSLAEMRKLKKRINISNRLSTTIFIISMISFVLMMKMTISDPLDMGNMSLLFKVYLFSSFTVMAISLALIIEALSFFIRDDELGVRIEGVEYVRITNSEDKINQQLMPAELKSGYDHVPEVVDFINNLSRPLCLFEAKMIQDIIKNKVKVIDLSA